MALTTRCMLRVPATKAGMLVESLRDQGIEAEAEVMPAKVQIKTGDLERVCAALKDAGIGYVVEPG